jgi:hypothetical protein
MRAITFLHFVFLASCVSLGLALAFPFVFQVMVPAMGFLLDFFAPKHK